MRHLVITLTVMDAPRELSPGVVVARCYHQRGELRDWYTLRLSGSDRWAWLRPDVLPGAVLLVRGELEQRWYRHQTHGHMTHANDVVAAEVEILRSGAAA